MTMPVAARQCAPTLTDDWITIEEAVRLTGELDRTWQRRAAWEAKQARRASRPSLAVQRAPESGGKPVWHVRRSIDARLTVCPRADERENRARPALLTKYPQDKVERAYRKAYWLREWRRACEGPQAAGRSEEAIAARIVADATERIANTPPQMIHNETNTKNIVPGASAQQRARVNGESRARGAEE